MSEHSSPTITVDAHQALVAVPTIEDGQEATLYFVDHDTPEYGSLEQIQAALDVAGAWNDVDWQETEQALERIRRQSTPTPPIVEG